MNSFCFTGTEHSSAPGTRQGGALTLKREREARINDPSSTLHARFTCEAHVGAWSRRMSAQQADRFVAVPDNRYGAASAERTRAGQ